MNQTETKAFDWLVTQGIRPSHIVFQGHKSPDFLIKDGRAYEVKKLLGNMILIYPRQWEEIRGFTGLQILVFNNGDTPLHIIPIDEIADGRTYWHTLRIHLLPPRGEDEMTLYLRKIPEDLSRAAKSKAALQGKTLSAWIAEAIKEKLDRKEGK